MEAKNLRNLFVKHFNFLQEEYDFKYDSSSHSYVKHNFEVQVKHISGELNVLLVSKGETKSLSDVLSLFLKKEFVYPDHFSSLVLSMGDVDSRLAYDAKLMKEHGKDIL